jgi:hypothetical protein
MNNEISELTKQINSLLLSLSESRDQKKIKYEKLEELLEQHKKLTNDAVKELQ